MPPMLFTTRSPSFGARCAERSIGNGQRLHPDAQSVVQALTDDLGEAEFSIPGQIVADIALASPPETAADGSISIRMEALTIAD